MPVSLNLNLLKKIASNQNAAELVFSGDVDLGGLTQDLFNAKLIAAFNANTNINTIVLQRPVSFLLVEKILLALKHIKPPIELGLNELDFAACVQVMLGLPELKKVSVLQLINLSSQACMAITDRLNNSPHVITLEVKDFSLDTAKIFAQALVNLKTVRGLRFYGGLPKILEEIMAVLPKTKVRILRVTQPMNSVAAVVKDGLQASKLYALDLFRVATENCITVMGGISKSKVDVLGLTELSPQACKAVMSRLPDKITLLFAIALSFDACEVVIEGLKKSKVQEVRLIGLDPGAKVLMLSGLESLGFIASKDDPDIFIKPGVVAISTTIPRTSGVKRNAEKAGVTVTTSSTKAARTASLQLSGGVANSIVNSSSIFQQPTQPLGLSGSEEHSPEFFKRPAREKTAEISEELSYGSPESAQGVEEEVTEAKHYRTPPSSQRWLSRN
jgi:hypothetical protein